MKKTTWRSLPSDKPAEDYPSLEVSSDSDDDIIARDDDISLSRERNLIDLTMPYDERMAGHAAYYSSDDLTNRILAAAMAVRQRKQEYSKGESYSAISDPSPSSKSNVSLRERFSRLSRNERRELLMRSGTPGVKGDADEDDDLNNTGPPNPHASTFSRSSASHGATSTQRIIKNRVIMHIYDLIAHDTLMQLPWGCVCEIGKCFNEMNSALHELGTGAYHVGVEVNGVEYAYGATNVPGKSGVFSCIPKCSPGYQYRSSIDFGERVLMRNSWVSVTGKNPRSTQFQHVEHSVDGRQVIVEMAKEYLGSDYDLLRKNCCTFAHDACTRLGIPEKEIPSWFRNLSESGAMTQDIAFATMAPIRQVLSACEEPLVETVILENGFETIAQRNAANTQDIVLVVDAVPNEFDSADANRSSVLRTATWAY